MELNTLKSTWQMYDKKIQASQSINEHIIESMIKERSFSRIEKMKNQYKGFFVLLTVATFVLSAVLLGNPFDFKHKGQFIPFVLLLVGIVLAFFNLIKYYKLIDYKVKSENVGSFLKKILGFYEQNKTSEKWFGIIFLSIGFLVPLSFLPPKIEKYGLNQALIHTVIPMAISIILYWLAFKLGAFKNRNKEHLKRDFEEYESLKSMIAELKIE